MQLCTDSQVLWLYIISGVAYYVVEQIPRHTVAMVKGKFSLFCDLSACTSQPYGGKFCINTKMQIGQLQLIQYDSYMPFVLIYACLISM